MTNPHFIFISEQFLAKFLNSNLRSTPHSNAKCPLSYITPSKANIHNWLKDYVQLKPCSTTRHALARAAMTILKHMTYCPKGKIQKVIHTEEAPEQKQNMKK